MAGDDKTAALVVALSAQLTKFERDMKRAGDIADREVGNIEKRFSSMNPSLSNAFFGNLFANLSTKALEKAVSLVGDLIDRFQQLEKLSTLVGSSMQDLFGVQQAASQFKVPIDDATQSIRNLATLLNQMQRGEKNSLTELFDANPEALKGINRQALTLQQTFEVVANIVANGFNNLDKIDLAKAAGQSESMVKFLEQGGRAVTDLAQKAAQAAPDFDRIQESTRQFSALMEKAADAAKSFFAQQTNDFLKSTIQDLEALINLSVKFLGLFQGGPLNDFAADASARLKSVQDSITAAKDAGTKPVRIVVTGGSTDRSGFSRVPVKDTGGGNVQDSFDRTEEQITRHTASIKADTIAVSQNSAVQAQLRAEFQLLNAIRKDEGEVTQAQIDQYTKLRETMSAQEALTASGINLTKEHAAAFISASEGAKQATAAYTEAADRVQKLNSASQQVGNALANSFADAIVEGKSLNDVLGSLLKSFAKLAINNAFQSIFSPQAGGGLSPFASLFGGGSSAGPITLGGASGPVPFFADGTNFAPGGMAVVGERGPELVNLPRGSQVIPNSALGGVGGQQFTFAPMVDARGADVAAVARLERGLAEMQAKFVSNVVSAVRMARTARAL